MVHMRSEVLYAVKLYIRTDPFQPQGESHNS